MKKTLSFIVTMLVIIFLTACSAGGSALTTGTSVEQITTSAQSEVNGAVATAEATSAAQVMAENEQIHETAGDDDVDLAAAISITLNGDSISASGAGISVDGSTVTITAPGDYRLSGTLADGQVIVDSSTDGVVRLVLDGVTLTHSTSSPLYIMDAEKVVLILSDGAQNTITDAAGYVFESAEVDEPNAAIFSKADLSIYGNGSLIVTGNYQDGISSKDGLIIDGGSITVTAVDDGIRGKDYLAINGGSLTVNAQGDGLKSDNEEDVTLGYVSVTAGTLAVNAGGDAIDAQTDVSVSGGEFTLTSGGGSGGRVSETTSAKGIKGVANVVIDGGTFNINTADDSVHSNGNVTINNGTYNLASADDAIHADQTLTINGGDIQISQSYEGLESEVITLNGGTVHLVASDDGVNAAGGNDGSGGVPGGSAGGDQDAASYTGAHRLYIHGGYLFVDARGDGLDVNGAIEMTGGVVLVNGPTEQMNGPIDYDGGFNISGGLLVATGSAGMAMTAGSYSSQNAVLVYLTGAQAGGTTVHIQDSSGKDILTFTPTHDYQSIAFSSPDLVNGQTYTVFTGGSTTGTVTDGLAQGGTYTAGSEAASFTISSTVMTVGTGGRMGGPGGHGPRP